MARISAPDFTADQLDQLKSLGVTPTQIRRLKDALLTSKAILHKFAPMIDVRDELKGIQSTLSAAQSSLKKFTSDGPKTQAAQEARVLVQIESDSADESMQSAIIALEVAQKEISAALDNLSPLPRRHRAAAPEPIQKIYSALVGGWGEEHQQIFELDTSRTGDEVAIPDFPFEPSSSLDSPFSRVVSICYTAIGVKSEPQRALKDFLKLMRCQEAARTERVAPFVEKWNAEQNPGEKPDVPTVNPSTTL